MIRNIILLVLLSFVSLIGKADSFSINGVGYEITGDKRVSVVSFDEEQIVPAWDGIMLQDSVEYDGNKYFVAEIGEAAFKDCRKLKRIYLAFVEKIGKSAFEGSGLRAISIPSNTIEIGERAFADCKELNSVYISENVERYGYGAFFGIDLKMLTMETCNSKVTWVFKDEEEHTVLLENIVREIFGRDNLNGVIFALPNECLHDAYNDPDIFEGMIHINTYLVGNDVEINSNVPAFCAPALTENENWFNEPLDIIPNAFWPEYSIIVDKGSKFSVMVAYLGMMSSKGVSKEKRRIPDLKFNGSSLGEGGFGEVRCWLNSPSYKLLISFWKPFIGEYMNTPDVVVPSLITIGATKYNSWVDALAVDADVQCQWYDSFGKRIVRCKINELPEDLNHGFYIGITDSGESIKIMR